MNCHLREQEDMQTLPEKKEPKTSLIAVYCEMNIVSYSNIKMIKSPEQEELL